MKILRHAAALCAALLLLPALAADPAFPVAGRPVRIVVGLAPGGPTDLQARVVAEHLRRELGTTVVVENRPGASMTLATAEVARAPADGHTLLYSPSTPFAQNPHAIASLPYDPQKDFLPLTVGSVGPLVLVAHNAVPAKTLPELVAYAKANPGKLNYGSFGNGSSSHLFGQLLAKQYGLEMVHIPYKGAGDVQKDLVGGRVQLMFAAAGGAVQFVRTGQVRMIGIAAPQRSRLLPGVPTLAEQGGKGLDIDGWVGFFLPAQVPPATAARLHAALVKVLADPQVKAEFEKGAYEAASSSPEAFAKTVKASYEQWGRIAQVLGVKKE
jgi:tripartite-type tricarboxylate transporter receptor subunit TctC